MTTSVWCLRNSVLIAGILACGPDTVGKEARAESQGGQTAAEVSALEDRGGPSGTMSVPSSLRSQAAVQDGCVLEHDTPMVDSTKAAELTDIADAMWRQALMARRRWQVEPWERPYPPFVEGSTREFFRGAASVARLAVSLNLTDARARLVLANLEKELAFGEPEAGLDMERAALAMGHARCAVEYGEAAGESQLVFQARMLITEISMVYEPDER